MINIKNMTAFVFLFYSSFLFANENNPDVSLTLARQYIDHDQGHEALRILQPLLSHASFDTDILTAQSYAEIDDPDNAKRYYQYALAIAHTPDEKQIAYEGIANMDLWLGNYLASEKHFKWILSYFTLNAEDSEKTKAGLMQDLINVNQPLTAYQLAPTGEVYLTQDMVVAAAEAAFWANWPYTAKAILDKNARLVKSISADNPLYGNLADISWQIDVGTRPVPIN